MSKKEKTTSKFLNSTKKDEDKKSLYHVTRNQQNIQKTLIFSLILFIE